MSSFDDDAFYAPRMSRFSPSPSQLAAVRVRELLAEGHDIIKLTTGEPDFPTPEVALEAANRAVREGVVGYTPVNGTLEMREAAQHKFRRDNDLDFGLDEITVGSGTKQILFNVLMATLDEGDEAIIPAPYWASYPDMVKLAGGTPVFVRCVQNAGFKLTPEQLAEAITPRTKWLMFNSPSNPTGAVYSREELAALAAVLLEHPQVHVLTDDVYEHLIFDGREFVTFAQVEPRLRPRTVTCNGISKAYSMTGWRVGFAGGPSAIIRNISKMQSQSTSGVSAVSQAAAAAVLVEPLDLVRERTANLQRRRDLLFDSLNTIPGLACDRPEGAMYIYCSCAGLIGRRTPGGRTLETDGDVTRYLLDEAGVAVVQGEAYGFSPYFRASFVAPEEDLVRAGPRIAEACGKLA